MANVDWSLYDESTDPNTIYKFLLDRTYDILSIKCPLRKFKQRTTSANWINKDILKAVRTRKFYVSLFRLTRQADHLRLSHIWRNKVNTMIDRAKATYIKSQLDRNVKNLKKFWRIINNFLGNKTVTYGDITFKDASTGLNTEKGTEATFLNNYFVNISTRLGLDSDTVYDNNNLPRYEVLDLLHLEHSNIGVAEIVHLAKDIDITKASCIRNINSRICKDLLQILPGKFCQLFNTSLNYVFFSAPLGNRLRKCYTKKW